MNSLKKEGLLGGKGFSGLVAELERPFGRQLSRNVGGVSAVGNELVGRRVDQSLCVAIVECGVLKDQLFCVPVMSNLLRRAVPGVAATRHRNERNRAVKYGSRKHCDVSNGGYPQVLYRSCVDSELSRRR